MSECEAGVGIVGGEDGVLCVCVCVLGGRREGRVVVPVPHLQPKDSKFTPADVLRADTFDIPTLRTH